MGERKPPPGMLEMHSLYKIMQKVDDAVYRSTAVCCTNLRNQR